MLVTGEKPLFLSKEDSIVYQMIAGRMIEAFSEKCVKDTATVTAECAGAEFVAKGSIIRQAGWRAVYGEEEKEETISPGWQEGNTLTLKATSITEGKTKPKPLHTEATLLSAMETAGKEIEDDALRRLSATSIVQQHGIRSSAEGQFQRRDTHGIAAKSGYSRSRLLMPLVFAAAMGGNLSLIGTITSPLAESRTIEAAMRFRT